MSTGTSPANEDPYRLPTNLKPLHYDIILRTDLEGLSFEGSVEISLVVLADTSDIVFNSSETELGNVYVYSKTKNTAQVAAFSSYDPIQQRMTYKLKEILPTGSKTEVKVSFSGKLAGSTRGYFYSSWQENGNTRYYSLTQLGPTAARRVFPCWDEPLLKARFSVTMISRLNTVNLSNMSVLSEKVISSDSPIFSDSPGVPSIPANGDWKITVFQTTPLMSTYLLAFANGHFDFLEKCVIMPLSQREVPLRIYTTPDSIHQAQYALDVSATVLPLYEKIFGVEYPLPKLDTLLARDFEGATENWGLIMGNATSYLLDPIRADEQSKKAIATLQSHEISHQWFGNVTTMEWWNYIYLNEGFATLMGEVIVPAIAFPQWPASSEFTTTGFYQAMSLDAKLSSHPIELDCPDSIKIDQIFDTLSYSKAASVLRMLSDYVGEVNFLQGVSLYLKKHLFANSTSRDLWEGIGTVTGLDIFELMEAWVSKTGYPVLSVTEEENGIKVRQDRFLETGSAEDMDDKTIWNVPLSLLSSGEDGTASVASKVLLRERETHIALDTSKPFKLNAGTIGFFRVLYTPERLVAIAAEAARHNSPFSVDDRIGLAQDVFALAKAGSANISSALTLVDLWRDETEYLVWQAIGAGLGELASIWWEDSGVIDKLNAFRRGLFVPLVEKLGYEYDENESSDDGLLRTLVIEQASDAGDGRVIQELCKRFKYYLKTGDDSLIPANLQRTIFSIAVKHGGSREYDAVVKIMNDPKSALERNAAMRGMSSPSDPELILRTAQYVTEKATKHDMVRLFAFLSTNFSARRLVSKHFEDNYEALSKSLANNLTMDRIVKYCFDFYSSQSDYDNIKAFFENKNTSKYDQSLAQTLENIRARSAYIEHSTDDLMAWLSKK